MSISNYKSMYILSITQQNGF